MNELYFNDTFDNLLFTNSGKFVQNDGITIDSKQNECIEKAGLSFDDSVFLSASLNCSSKETEIADAKTSYNKETNANNVTTPSYNKLNITVNKSNIVTPKSKRLPKENLKNCTPKGAAKTLQPKLITNENTPIATTKTIEPDTKITQNHNISINKNNILTEVNENTADKKKHLYSQSDSSKLSSWGLPEPILQKYESRNISRMFTWQVECLLKPNILSENRNLVYSAPTSAGKTLVAEILAIKTVLERRKKVILILPFVSVVREKMFYFQDILGTSGIRVDGFMGSYNPPGGFKGVQVAICTIEKANGLVNRLMEENKLSDIGAIIVDEMHLLGDTSRGYLLELLLTKIRYMSLKCEDINIQVIGMSATLPNLPLLAKWLDAELFTTDFRPVPLLEQCHIQGEIYDNKYQLLRKLKPIPDFQTDTDNILQLCLETINVSCSVLIFCPAKNWCENLALQLAEAFWKLGSSNTDLGAQFRKQLNVPLVKECLEQLKACPVGLDDILAKTVNYGVGFHHAGLTMDERDIIEGGFRTGSIRVLIATSTLSSGVNLPARRVIVRSPKFFGKPINTLTYRQMIGRAGRMGKDTMGESILICQKNEYKIAEELMSAKLDSVESCLEGAGKLKRAILEVITSNVASTPDEVDLFTKCTLLAHDTTEEKQLNNPIEESINFLIKNEFIRLQIVDNGASKYVATSLAKACLSASLPPEEGLTLFAELEKARECFVLETELHLIYLVTPYTACKQLGTIDWLSYLNMWESLPASMKRVSDLVGVTISYMINCSRGKTDVNTTKGLHKMLIHKRFYTALILQDLVNEMPLITVCKKYDCNRGVLQSLQQQAATFAGMVTSFSKQLGWSSVEILISQFQDRLQFGVSRDLLDLMRLPILNGQRARALYNAGIETLIDLAGCELCMLENILHKSRPFESEKEREGESKFDTEKRNNMKTIWVAGKQGVTEREAAVMLIEEARRYLQHEMGLSEAKWSTLEYSNGTKNNADESQNNVNINLMQNDIPVDLVDNSKASTDSMIHEIKKDKGDILTDEDFKSKSNTLSESCGLNESCDNDLYKIMENKSTIIETTNQASVAKSIVLAQSSITSVEDFENSFTSASKSNKQSNLSNIDFDSLISKNNSLDLSRVSATSEHISDKAIMEWDSMDLSKFSDISAHSSHIEKKQSSETKFKVPNNSHNLNNSNSPCRYNLRSRNCTEKNNLSNQNLFEDSFGFDSKIINEIEHKNNPNSIVLCDKSSLINEFMCSFNGKEPSDDKSCSKKRSLDIISSGEDDLFERTPLKRKKCSKRKPSISTTFIISDSKINEISVKKENESKVDLQNFEIINVCDDKKLTQSFCKELRMHSTISLAVACEKITEKKPAIGENVIKRNSFAGKTDEYIYKNRKVVGIVISWGGNTVYYICLKEKCKAIMEILKDFLGDEKVSVRIFDCKEQVKVLKQCCDLDFESKVEDPKVGVWLLDPEGKEKNLQEMTLVHSPEAMKLCQLAGNSKGSGSVALELNSGIDARIRASIECLISWHLMESLHIALQEENLFHTFSIEMSCTLILSKMELTGFGIDSKTLQGLSDDLKNHCSTIERKAFELAGRRFSFTSSTDVAKVLNVYKGRRMSTNKQFLEQSDNPISDLIILWRKVSSTLTKMVYPLLRLIEKNRIHGTCITHNSTGRISMQEPNLQNVPRDFDIADINGAGSTKVCCRKAFIAGDATVLVSADYCQLELRILAHLSQDDLLCSIMQYNEDIFRSIAAKWNNISEDEVTDSIRQRVKQICYGIIYGMGVRTLAEQLCVSENDALEFTDRFHQTYPGIKKFITLTISNCKEREYVETVSGRRRYLPHINNTNPTAKSQAERQAVNSTIQGSAADIAKNAMVVVDFKINEKFKSSRNKPKLVLQLHDELLYEVPSKYEKMFARILKKCMQESVKLSIPFPVKLKSGKSWGQMIEMKL